VATLDRLPFENSYALNPAAAAVREYLASEAPCDLGTPTTRALSIVGSERPVQRERVETAATLVRLSPSHVRFGSFEYFAARGETKRVRELVNHLIEQHFEGSEDDATRHPRFFGEVCLRTARLMFSLIYLGSSRGYREFDGPTGWTRTARLYFAKVQYLIRRQGARSSE